MRSITTSLFMSLSCLFLAALGWPDAHAQRAAENRNEAGEDTRRVPSIGERVYERLAAAEACIEASDFACAGAELQELREMPRLNGFETAQMWNFYAYLYLEQEDFSEAIAAYERVLQEPEITLGLEATTLYALATLYFQQEQYEHALDALERWSALDQAPTVNAYVLEAHALYQLGRLTEAVEPLHDAIALADEQEREPEEGWYRLLNVIYFELDRLDEAIEISTILATRWTRAEHVLQLANMYSQTGQEEQTLALYEAAYDAGWLQSSGELVTFASLLLQAEIPYKAARVLEEGLDEGAVEASLANWRLLGQAWQLAQEHERALPVFARASKLASDGRLDLRLAHSHSSLYRWEECIASAEEALRRGGLDDEDEARIVLVGCLVQSQRLDEAREVLEDVARDGRRRAEVENWLSYIQGEEARLSGSASPDQ